MTTLDIMPVETTPILCLPGIEASKTALIVSDDATTPELMTAFGRIAKMEKSVAWWLGDLGIGARGW
jgi:hypothetical protein